MHFLWHRQTRPVKGVGQIFIDRNSGLRAWKTVSFLERYLSRLPRQPVDDCSSMRKLKGKLTALRRVSLERVLEDEIIADCYRCCFRFLKNVFVQVLRLRDKTTLRNWPLVMFPQWGTADRH